MKKYIFLLLIVHCSLFTATAQVTNVKVETYYISDSNDATDTTGGKLEAGSTTYRVYIELKAGTKLLKIYGDTNHPLKFSSTANFFNNIDRGTSFGKDIDYRWLKSNTTALDTWITLGLATKKHKGVLKTEDTDGSIIGGKNNDGGSDTISGGLLVNADPAAGVPLTAEDGMVIADSLPSSWASYGFTDLISGEDLTIFGSLKAGSEFISYNAGLQCSGVMGATSDNIVLAAQLTTKGDIKFELNIEVEEKDNGELKIVKYVANNSNLLSDEKFCPYLNYPPVCGCQDAKYLEYNSKYTCSFSDSCKTLIVFGCKDPMACNYDPKANFNIPDLCCYPGNCNDRDISVVCPVIVNNNLTIGVFPNPARDFIDIQISSNNNKEIRFEIYDFFGRLVQKKNLGTINGDIIQQLNLSALSNGLYFLRLFRSDGVFATKMFMKD